MLYLYLCGLCMGAADLVPGISGGTIAFIMGFYNPLLEALKTINLETLKLLLKGRFSQFFDKTAWKFLLPLVGGIATSFIFLTGFLHFILRHEIYQNYLYAGFTGLVLGSSLYCFKQIERLNLSNCLMLLLGAAIAYFFTGSNLVSTAHYIPMAFIDPWLMICGVLAISAMLLPGISGSYLLTLLGVYPSVIGALALFIANMKAGIFDVDAFSILFSLFLGILVGIFSFARVVSWLLNNFPGPTLSLLTGFMLGGIRSIWPFTESMGGEMMVYSGFFCLGGFGLVLAVEYLAGLKKGHHSHIPSS